MINYYYAKQDEKHRILLVLSFVFANGIVSFVKLFCLRMSFSNIDMSVSHQKSIAQSKCGTRVSPNPIRSSQFEVVFG